MEPDLVTDPMLVHILNELVQREPVFHRPELGTTRRDFENMTDPNFWEVGASGRRYSREYVLDTLEKRYENPTEEIWETRGFHCLEIAPDNYLLTYTLVQGERVTCRATIWRRTELGWKIVYHQGTVVIEKFIKEESEDRRQRATVIYARVSTRPQIKDLHRRFEGRLLCPSPIS